MEPIKLKQDFVKAKGKLMLNQDTATGMAEQGFVLTGCSRLLLKAAGKDKPVVSGCLATLQELCLAIHV